MEWVETTGKSLDEAKDRALDQLGVASDEAEFEVIEEPRSGLFGRMRGEARVRARVMPAAVRPKQDRRVRGRGKSNRDERGKGRGRSDRDGDGGSSTTAAQGPKTAKRDGRPSTERKARSGGPVAQHSDGPQTPRQQKESKQMDDAGDEQRKSSVTPQEVGDAAVAFMSGLAGAFAFEATTTLHVDGTDLDVRVDGAELGLMVGPGGRTLIAIQDLARVASQRRLGDHETRLRIDVAGYREKRRAALEKFAHAVATQVLDSGEAKALEPMPSVDRKIVHDALVDLDGIASRSEGDDPMRRVVISRE